jgi:hypothetical protein
VEDVLEAAGERLVQVGAQVGGEDDDAGEILDPLKQIGHLLIHRPVVGVPRLGTLVEQEVRFVEEEDPALELSLSEEARQALLRLLGPFRENLGEIDLEDRQSCGFPQESGGQSLARSRRAKKQGSEAGFQGRLSQWPKSSIGGSRWRSSRFWLPRSHKLIREPA